MCENAYLSIKNPKASRALKRALDPGRRMLASLTWLHFAMSATFGLRSWGPPLTKSWIRTCCLEGGVCPGGVCLGECLPRRGCTIWPIPSCIWCYLYVVPAPTETEQQCSCLYSAGHVICEGTLGYTLPPWTEFLIRVCENITFSQLLLRAVKNFAFAGCEWG